MKKEFVLGLAAGLTVAGASLVFANSQIQAILNDQIKVTLNGQVQEFKDETTNETQYPITYKDRTYLPLRTVANLVGVGVDYDANTNTAMLSRSNHQASGTNTTDDLAYKERYEHDGKFYVLNYKGTITNPETLETKFDQIYASWFFLSKELKISGPSIESKTISFPNKVIKDVWSYTLDARSSNPYYDENDNTWEADTGLYLLFQDGTVGMIKTADIVNGSNKLTLFENVNNVEWFWEGGTFQTDSTNILYGVDSNGKVVITLGRTWLP